MDYNKSKGITGRPANGTDYAANGPQDAKDAAQKAECLRCFTAIANAAYENILKPADSMEKLENEGPKAQADRMEFDFENGFGQRIISCAEHHFNCIMLYRKYFRAHTRCQIAGDDVTKKAVYLVARNENKQLSQLTLRKIDELLSLFYDWRERLDYLHDTSLTVPPIKKRLTPTTSKNQVEAIYHISEEENYDVLSVLEPDKRTAELKAREGEKFILLDNTNRLFWTVKNKHGEVGELPSLFLSNCGPDATLIRKSARLEDEFSAVVRKVLNLLEVNPGPQPQTNDMKRSYARMLVSAAKRNNNVKSMPRSPIMSRAQSRETLDGDLRKDEKIIEYTTTLTEVTVIEETTCYAPEYSEFTGHEVQMFLVSGVVDPRDFMEISIDEARRYGIVDTQKGVYNNIESGEQIPISEAMQQGLIRVEKSVTRRQKERETKRRARSYEHLL